MAARVDEQRPQPAGEEAAQMGLPGQLAAQPPPHRHVHRHQQPHHARHRPAPLAQRVAVDVVPGEQAAGQPEQRPRGADHRDLPARAHQHPVAGGAAQQRHPVEQAETGGADTVDHRATQRPQGGHVHRQVHRAAMQEAVGQEHRPGLPGKVPRRAEQQAGPEAAPVVGGLPQPRRADQAGVARAQYHLDQHADPDQAPDPDQAGFGRVRGVLSDVRGLVHRPAPDPTLRAGR
jgi:hypothetical protein